jgi:N-acylneuraminate cytidylyltransferase
MKTRVEDKTDGLHVIAIIPARGGSKRVPGKNLMILAGHPLIAHSILQARRSRARDVYVSTEDREIEAVARAYGAEVVRRPAELADDRATSEAALLHVLNECNRQGRPDPDLVVFLQCTSPVRRDDDIDRAVETLLREKADSLFSACENNRLIWALKDGAPYSVNYDYRSRRREQDMEVQYRENGSIYVFRPEVLRQKGNRLGGRIAVYEMDYWSSFQIDAGEHAELIEWVMRRPGYHPKPEWPAHIQLVVFDFDGVMTDNTVWIDERRDETVRCDRGDGWGIARLNDAKVPMMVLSTEEHPVVAARCAKLRLPCVQGCGDKAAKLAALLAERGIDPTDVIYVGNDVNDLACLRMVGMPVAVGDAHPEVKAASKLVLTKKGGRGAVREFCDLLLEVLHARESATSVTPFPSPPE